MKLEFINFYKFKSLGYQRYIPQYYEIWTDIPEQIKNERNHPLIIKIVFRTTSKIRNSVSSYNCGDNYFGFNYSPSYFDKVFYSIITIIEILKSRVHGS